ncbi:hypothetical protein DFA_06641 [Cavenderia fasciculata]|uniref:RNA helicase n=1 Tax=Cavenderia fasciculata TaxID=261658 RepID=F4Q1V5_CACFS|nr:uncharacterized protein DFA_06641 [Cavenderia fasciculata]EGG17975.1 hypothetical protein DFA_06641 [Cavenderia fasciculata]|eukprot:XP_004356867.1 hypothetical protein DFA_06641 [Cavenderia fasciculata]
MSTQTRCLSLIVRSSFNYPHSSLIIATSSSTCRNVLKPNTIYNSSNSSNNNNNNNNTFQPRLNKQLISTTSTFLSSLSSSSSSSTFSSLSASIRQYSSRTTLSKKLDFSKNNDKDEDEDTDADDELVNANQQQQQQQPRDITNQNQFFHWNRITKKKHLDERIWKSIKQQLWYNPTEIQSEIIPIMLDNRNVLASSQTGSGKTASYLIPILQIISNIKKKIDQDILNPPKEEEEQDESLNQKEDVQEEEEEEEEEEKEKEKEKEKKWSHQDKYGVKPRLIGIPDIGINNYGTLEKGKDPLALILVPSKDLAVQVTRDMDQLNRFMALKVVSIIGGVGEHTQRESLGRGCDVLIATPGRLLVLLESGAVSLSKVHITVVDEFDKLFNMGFFPDTKQIFKDYLPRIANRSRPMGMQTSLISATIVHEKYDDLITRFAPNHIMVNLNQELKAPDQVRQHFYQVSYRKKRALLMYFFRRSPASKTSLRGRKVLVFARTQQRVENLKQSFMEKKIGVVAIHADMSMAARNNALISFKEDDDLKVLVCTDVMTRGIHIDCLDAVVNFDVPHVSEDYLHRIGRAGRLGRQGFSLTFVSRESLVFEVGKRTVGLNEGHLLTNIERLMGKQVLISKVPGPWTEDDIQGSTDGSDITIRVSEEDGREEDFDEYDYQAREEEEEEETRPKRKQESEKPRSIVDREYKKSGVKEKKAVTDMLLKQKVLESFRGPPTRDGLPRVRFNPNAKLKNRRMSKVIVDRKGEIHDLPPITDFESGRYESVVQEFDRKRASKRGVGLKEKNIKVFTPSKIMTKRQENKLKDLETKKDK